MKLKLLVMLFSTLLFFQANAQSLSLSPSEIFAKCPGEFLTYTVTNTSTAACTYNWTVTNGEITGGILNGSVSTFTGGTVVQIKWVNTTSNGSIQIVGNCSPTSGNATKTWTIPILSINGVVPGAISGVTSINVNVTSNQIYSVPQINYPNIGSGDVSPKQVDSYEWEIPAGWIVVSGGTTRTITVTPDNCTGGVIRVRGKNTSCTAGPFYSNWSTINLGRTVPTPGTITGPISVICTDLSQKTYSVTSVAGTTYTWTLPSNWQGTSSTSSITVTPSGNSGGVITVVANVCSLQSQPRSLTIGLDKFNPATPPQISGVNLICNTGQYVLQNQPASTSVVWTTSNTSALTIDQQGAVVRQNAYNGTVDIIANITGPCGALAPVTKSIYVGIPLADNTTLIYPNGYRGVDPVSLCSGCTYNFQVDFVPGATTYSWVLPSGFSFVSGRNTATPGIRTSATNGTYVLYCSPSNTCGPSWTHSLTINVGGGAQQQRIQAFPNPVQKELIIEDVFLQDSNVTTISDETIPQDFSITLFNSQNSKVKSGLSAKGKLILDVQDLPNGLYYLHVQKGEELTVEQIQIKK